MTKHELGDKGEIIAKENLLQKGYLVLEQNYRWGKGEIDLICKKEQTLVFVEVKTRQTSYFGEPYQAVTRQKQKQIIKVANQYIMEGNIGLDVRFDVVSIILNSKRKAVNHIENAFVPLV